MQALASWRGGGTAPPRETRLQSRGVFSSILGTSGWNNLPLHVKTFIRVWNPLRTTLRPSAKRLKGLLHNVFKAASENTRRPPTWQAAGLQGTTLGTFLRKGGRSETSPYKPSSNPPITRVGFILPSTPLQPAASAKTYTTTQNYPPPLTKVGISCPVRHRCTLGVIVPSALALTSSLPAVGTSSAPLPSPCPTPRTQAAVPCLLGSH